MIRLSLRRASTAILRSSVFGAFALACFLQPPRLQPGLDELQFRVYHSVITLCYLLNLVLLCSVWAEMNKSEDRCSGGDSLYLLLIFFNTSPHLDEK